ncbi:Crp/Fnr family transcriptional regulator [Thermomonas sp. HDW16]|uniref:Crp/Fnr family transcriptional regulator n=1 Tax=Thermomonas sp. HDW16 TaxID=2714945 RepID=UPI00140D215A|nr:Crp/Fnr family transcriptional regulator [Thermomonas sp. HDW16]QIL21339.1 Crp/Fnr family transcriptional regulator [Thermomonas sp. HDW16]
MDLDKRIPQELLRRLLTAGDTRRYAAGEILFHQGDASDALYVLLSGRLRVYSGNANGREVVYNVLEPGDTLGELLLDGGPRSASVQAVTESECLVIKSDALRTLIRTYPELAERLMLRLIARLRHATRTIHSLALDGVFERVTTLLEENAVVDGETRHVPAYLTQQEIANRIGATREMVNHVMQRLRRDGYISRNAQRRTAILKPLPKHG